MNRVNKMISMCDHDLKYVYACSYADLLFCKNIFTMINLFCISYKTSKRYYCQCCFGIYHLILYCFLLNVPRKKSVVHVITKAPLIFLSINSY